MTDNANAAHRRKLERKSVEVVVEVYDTGRESYLGRLVNITEEGLMVMGETSVSTEKLYQLELRYQLESQHKIISVGADCLWHREGSIDESYWAGFQMIEVSENARVAIKELIGKMSN